MTQPFKDHFSQVSLGYRNFRPDYPPELFRWLSDLSPRRETALDCGCGTGQAAVALAPYFGKVYAVDPSAEQIAQATAMEGVTYLVAPAENTGLPAHSQDLVIAAQALHWFDFELFYPEVRRVARDGAVFAAFTYGLLTVNPEIDDILGKLYHDILGGHWPPERRHVDEGYRNLPFPFREIPAPEFSMSAQWGLDHLLGYLATWSAVKEFKAVGGEDPLQPVEGEFRRAWGDGQSTNNVSWPLIIRVGYID